MMPWSRATIAACLAVAATVSGCVDLKKTYPEKRSFVLDVGAPPHEAPSKGGVVLRINKFRVSPLFAGRAMVYRIADLQYETDFYDEWFVAPAMLVTQQAQHWLSASGGIELVFLGLNHVEPTHLLEGTITEFYGDFRGDPRAVFGVDLHLLDAGQERKVFFRRTYHQEVPLTDRSSEALARGLSEGLRAVLIEVAQDVAAADTARK